VEEGNVGYSWALPVVAETWDGYLNDVNVIAWRLQHHPPSEDVIMTGPSRKPDFSTQVVPVISPFPFSVNRAKNRIARIFAPRKHRRDPGAHRTHAHFQWAFPGYQCGVTDLD